MKVQLVLQNRSTLTPELLQPIVVVGSDICHKIYRNEGSPTSTDTIVKKISWNVRLYWKDSKYPIHYWYTV